MILPDVNVWLALTIGSHVHHADAVRWLAGIRANGVIAFCRATQQGYLRILTHPGVQGAFRLPAITNAQAWDSYEALRSDDRITFAPEPEGIDPVWRGFAARSTASPKQWMDAYLAAFALAGHHELATFDSGFRRFAGLQVRVPGEGE